jgi:hypothetical protein
MIELQITTVGEFLLDDLIAQLNAFVTDVHTGAGNEFLDLLLGLAAERALQQFTGFPEFGHVLPL